jgi:hypothetical protein
MVAPKAPPPARGERPTPAPRPIAQLQWRPGNWRWDGAAFVWDPGRWIDRPTPTALWSPGRWIPRGADWVWEPGKWI